MSSVLNTFSLKQKLILFAAIPMLLLTLFGSWRMFALLDSYQEAQKNTLAIEIGRDAELLIFELQRERGLTAGYVSSQGDKYQDDLIQQRTHTDKQATKLLNNPSLSHFVSALPNEQSQAQSLRENLESITAKSYQISAIRTGADLQQDNEAFTFYSEYNHQLLVLISQLQMQTKDAFQAKAYNDLLNVLTIQEMAAKERGLMNQMLSAKYLDSNAYIRINSIEHELDESLSKILLTASPQNRQFIREVLASESHQQVLQIRTQLKSQVHLIEQAYKLSRLMGYGGMIHDFKNYLLRGEQVYFDSFSNSISQLQFKIHKLKQINGLPREKRAAILEIDETINEYHNKIDMLRLLKQQKLTIAEQDKLVRIADEPMVKSLSKLQYQNPEIDNEYWWKIASERIDKLHQLSHHITDEIAYLGRHQKTETLMFLSLGLAVGSINLLLLFLLGRSMINNLVGSIALIANNMQKMAHDPNLELTVPEKGSDEIALMSQALNQMLNERRKASRQLNLAAAVFKYSAEGIVVTDAKNQIELVNPAFTQITGYTLDDIKGKNPSVLNSNQQSRHFYNDMWASLKEHGKWEGELWNTRKNGEVYPEYLAITLVRNDSGKIIQHIGLFLDISNRKKYEKDIWYNTNYDQLTGLPNRALYIKKMQQDIALSQQNNQQLALLFIDLDRFKYTNDLYGHTVGNQLLTQVASRLESLKGHNHFVARLSGDEFIIILANIDHQQQAQLVAEDVITRLSSPFGVNDDELMISASIGISLFPQNGTNEELLTRNAETAMYQAKNDGRSNYRYYSPEMNEHMLERIQLEQRLRQAVIQHEFCLHYQPIVNLSDQRIIGVEALIRWQDPKFGLIPPDKFIPIAEETGLIEPIGEWVIQQGLTDLARWHEQGFMLNMAINVSGRQLLNHSQSSFSCLLKTLLQKHNIEPKYLHVEITESLLMEDTEKCLLALQSIRSLGIDIYIDDFGTGYSSLSYLKRFPISVIKIDKSFVDNMLDMESDAKLIKAIVMMGQSLELKLVAEGIEQHQQWEALQDLGCDFGQGYLFSKPLPSPSLEQLLLEQMEPA